MIRLAADRDRAAVRVDRAGEDLDERALAGAVGAHQRMDLARMDGQRRGPQGRDGAISLGDPGRLEQQVWHQALTLERRWMRGDAGGADIPTTGDLSESRVTRPGPCRR